METRPLERQTRNRLAKSHQTETGQHSLLRAIMLLLCLPSLLCAQTPGPGVKGEKDDFAIIAYYRGGVDEIDKYPVEKLTHIIYTFLHLRGNQLSITNTKSEAAIKHLVSLKKKHTKLKVMLALGGWGGCKTCSGAFSTAEGRSEFARSATDMLLKYDADGLDLDWEYPAIEGVPGHPYSAADRHNFTLLVEELRKNFGNRFELSFAAGGFTDFLEKSIEWKEVMELVDRVNLMSYDLVNGYSKNTGHHTPLNSFRPEDESTRKAVQFLDSLNIPMQKIVIGAAFYARVWEKVQPVNNGLFQSGVFKRAVAWKNFKSYFTKEKGFKEYYDPAAGAWYQYSPREKQFATYDNRASVKAKTAYARSTGLGGIMFWQLTSDTYKHGLLDAIYEAAQGK